MGFGEPYISIQTLEAVSLTNISLQNVSNKDNTSEESMIVSANDISMIWILKKTKTAQKWAEKAFVELNALRKSFTNAEYYIFSQQWTRYEDWASLKEDFGLFLISGCLLLVYSLIATCNLRKRGSRMVLTLAGFFSVALSLGAAFGVMVAANVPFTSISIIIPYVVVGESLIFCTNHGSRN